MQKRSYNQKNTHQTAQNIGSQRMYGVRSHVRRHQQEIKPWHVKKSDVLFSVHIFQIPNKPRHCRLSTWDLRENLIPKAIKRNYETEWPLLVVFDPVAPVGDVAWTLNQHGQTGPVTPKPDAMGKKPCVCDQLTQHPYTMTRSRPKGTSSFFLLASWQPEQKL